VTDLVPTMAAVVLFESVFFSVLGPESPHARPTDLRSELVGRDLVVGTLLGSGLFTAAMSVVPFVRASVGSCFPIQVRGQRESHLECSRTAGSELDDADPRLVATARTVIFRTFRQACSMAPDVAVFTLHHVVVPGEGLAADVTSL
jgi:hypothetical protein